MNGALDFIHRFHPGTDPQAPPLLLLHGTGGDENDLLPLGEVIAPGAALLSPRGKVLEAGAPRFFRRLAEGVFDQQDLALRTRELAGFLEAASLQYGFDQRRLVAVGFSNGANIAASLLLRFPHALAGAILIRAMLPFVPESDAPQSLAGKKILLLNGRNDHIVPPDQPERLAEILRAAGADVQLEWQAGGHGLLNNDIERAQGWMAALRGSLAARA